MGYLHIDNYPKVKHIISLFREVYVLEKIHGTSTHIAYDNDDIRFFAGGCDDLCFRNLFGTIYPSKEELLESFRKHFLNQKVIIYGEGYGGKMQGMRHLYGDQLSFIAFDVCINGKWLAVHDAASIIQTKFNLPFVWYKRTDNTEENLNLYRDQNSPISIVKGCTPVPGEGIIIRPIVEMTLNNENRVIAKYKREAFSERKTKEKDPNYDKYLTDATAVADEWVTPNRLEHVLDHLKATGTDANDYKHIPIVIRAMIEDVLREGQGCFEVTEATSRAIGRKTAILFRNKIESISHE